MKLTKAKVAGKHKRIQRGGGFIKDLVRTEEGVVSSRIFVDPEIYGLELEQIFAQSWLFVAHESEIPQAGDFVTRYMGEDPVIVWRGQDGKIRVFLNVCRHRGRKVCGEDLGRAAQFRCPYHGWTYNNGGELISVPFFEGYQGKLDMGGLGLYQAPRVGLYHGLIFAHWEAAGESLSEYLGEMAWVLDLLFGRTAGMEVVGTPMRWEADANWKLGAANFAGDGQHTHTTHGFQSAVGLELIRGKSFAMPTNQGHTAALKQRLPGSKGDPYLALPQELWPEIESHLAEDQLKIAKSLATVVGNVFPNMSFLNTVVVPPPEWGGPEGRSISFLTVRQWQPKRSDRMEVWTWFFVDKNAPQWWKQASKETYSRSFGMAGVFEQDDMENWVEITQALRGPIAGRLLLQYRMGLEATPAKDWPGSGVVYSLSSLSELNERVFYRHWQKLLMESPYFGAGPWT